MGERGEGNLARGTEGNLARGTEGNLAKKCSWHTSVCERNMRKSKLACQNKKKEEGEDRGK